jgi:hypothetical protein
MSNDENKITVISPSTLGEANTAFSMQIDETVKMSTYKIKKSLEAALAVAQKGADNLDKAIRQDLDPLVDAIRKRATAQTEELALTSATKVLIAIWDFIRVGDDGTYFDDNRGTGIELEDISKAMVTVGHCSITSLDYIIKYEEVSVPYSLGLYGSRAEGIYQLDDAAEILYTPKSSVHTMKLENHEVGTINNYRSRKAERMAYRKEISQIGSKLENLPKIAEDIEFALLQAKAESSGNTQSVQLSDDITKAFLSGVDPSVALLASS